MDGTRVAASARVDADGSVTVTLDYVEVADGRILPGEPALSETFRVAPGRADCRYVSRAVIHEATALPGTFWVDARGLRHFHLAADAGNLNLFGKDCALDTET